MSTFDQLVAEGEAVPTEGGDFSWFTGRATEERPSWKFATLLAERELTDAMMGPQVVSPDRDPLVVVAAAEAAGLEVVDLRREALRMEFHDIASVVVFLREVVWTVPGFTVDGYRARLARLHDFIERHGPFVAHSQRFLVEAVRPR
ncbi:hypothetical protein [Saccharothrix hoggarensis]|uniref:Mycolic acid cyclopropane synthetase n=1 Tax=Saccharothrix hoggarensis TaxID=913853 RepID=A0ABW3QZF6_9PSEU